MATKQQLIDWFSDGLAATGEKFAALINSLKGMQTAVSSPTTSGSAVAFIDSISQNEEGVITATKKSVSFSGYQTTAGMINYQDNDLWLKVMYFEKQKPTVNVIGVTIKRLKMCGDITTKPKSKYCFCTIKL